MVIVKKITVEQYFNSRHGLQRSTQNHYHLTVISNLPSVGIMAGPQKYDHQHERPCSHWDLLCAVYNDKLDLSGHKGN